MVGPLFALCLSRTTVSRSAFALPFAAGKISNRTGPDTTAVASPSANNREAGQRAHRVVPYRPAGAGVPAFGLSPGAATISNWTGADTTEARLPSESRMTPLIALTT